MKDKAQHSSKSIYLSARNMVVGIDDAKAGPIKIAGNPIKLSNHADPKDRGPVPALDQDRERIIAELDGK